MRKVYVLCMVLLSSLFFFFFFLFDICVLEMLSEFVLYTQNDD